MTHTTTTTVTPATTTTPAATGSPRGEQATTDVVTHLLEQLVRGNGVSPDLFVGDAGFDATVPNWRFSLRGADQISAQLTAWFSFEEPARYDELRRIPTPTGEVVHLSVAWRERGVLHAAHQSLTIDLEDGAIGGIGLWCGGRWPASLLAEMEAANMAATR